MVGIYKIENLINHKVYIGQSWEIEKRLNQYRIDSNNNTIRRRGKDYNYEEVIQS
jgi:hypothetical protein